MIRKPCHHSLHLFNCRTTDNYARRFTQVGERSTKRRKLVAAIGRRAPCKSPSTRKPKSANLPTGLSEKGILSMKPIRLHAPARVLTTAASTEFTLARRRLVRRAVRDRVAIRE